jgi:Ubiquitin carboxyl-terminal hydrolase/Est1 DNA/RNA binding domain/Telomerase activating protein Est1
MPKKSKTKLTEEQYLAKAAEAAKRRQVANRKHYLKKGKPKLEIKKAEKKLLEFEAMYTFTYATLTPEERTNGAVTIQKLQHDLAVAQAALIALQQSELQSNLAVAQAALLALPPAPTIAVAASQYNADFARADDLQLLVNDTSTSNEQAGDDDDDDDENSRPPPAANTATTTTTTGDAAAVDVDEDDYSSLVATAGLGRVHVATAVVHDHHPHPHHPRAAGLKPAPPAGGSTASVLLPSGNNINNNNINIIAPHIIFNNNTWFELRPEDVLIGHNDSGRDEHAGNLSFRQLVDNGTREYMATNSKNMEAIARKVVCAVYGMNGRFLRKLDSANREVIAASNGVPASTCIWICADDAAATEEAKRALQQNARKITSSVLDYAAAAAAKALAAAIAPPVGGSTAVLRPALAGVKLAPRAGGLAASVFHADAANNNNNNNNNNSNNVEPQPADVQFYQCGGGGTNDSKGSVAFRQLVADRTTEYMATNSKTDIVLEIINAVREKNGRFLRAEGYSSHVWVPVDDDKVVDMVMAALRKNAEIASKANVVAPHAQGGTTASVKHPINNHSICISNNINNDIMAPHMIVNNNTMFPLRPAAMKESKQALQQNASKKTSAVLDYVPAATAAAAVIAPPVGGSTVAFRPSVNNNSIKQVNRTVPAVVHDHNHHRPAAAGVKLAPLAGGLTASELHPRGAVTMNNTNNNIINNNKQPRHFILINNTPLPLPRQPYDVLIGHDSGPNDEHVGNLWFQQLVDNCTREYMDATTNRVTKAKIERAVVSAVRVKNGRFLRKLDSATREVIAASNGVSASSCIWIVADDDAAMEEAKQALQRNASQKNSPVIDYAPAAAAVIAPPVGGSTDKNNNSSIKLLDFHKRAQALAAKLKSATANQKQQNKNKNSNNDAIAAANEAVDRLRMPFFEIMTKMLLVDAEFLWHNNVVDRLFRYCFYNRIDPQRTKIMRAKRRGAKGKQLVELERLQVSLNRTLVGAFSHCEFLIENLEKKLLSPSSGYSQSGQEDVLCTQQTQSTYGTATTTTTTDDDQENLEFIVPVLNLLYIQLGDLHRYMTLQLTQAQACYEMAARLGPGHGHAYHQIAVTCQSKEQVAPQSPLSVDALYWYARSVLPTVSPFFAQAQANLNRLFTSNRQWLQQHLQQQQQEAPPSAGVVVTHATKAGAVRTFLGEFCDLQYDFYQGMVSSSWPTTCTTWMALQKIAHLMESLYGLLQLSAFGDALICKMVTILAFSECHVPSAAANAAVDPSHSNSNNHSNADSILRTTALAVRTMTYQMATLLADEVLHDLRKINEAAAAAGTGAAAGAKYTSTSSASIHLLLPLLLVAEFTAHREATFFVTTTTTAINSNVPMVTSVYSVYYKNAMSAFWKKMVDVWNRLNPLAVAMNVDKTKVDGLQDYDSLRGFAPFSSFIATNITNSTTAVTPPPGFLTAQESVAVILDKNCYFAGTINADTAATTARNSTQETNSTKGSSSTFPSSHIKIARMLALAKYLADDSTSELGLCIWRMSNGEYKWVEANEATVVVMKEQHKLPSEQQDDDHERSMPPSAAVDDNGDGDGRSSIRTVPATPTPSRVQEEEKVAGGGGDLLVTTTVLGSPKTLNRWMPLSENSILEDDDDEDERSASSHDDGSCSIHREHQHHQQNSVLVPNPCRGLENLKNTCYMNASLQMLYTLKDFCGSLTSTAAAGLVDGNSRSSACTTLLLTKSVKHIYEELQVSTTQNNGPVRPDTIKNAMDGLTGKFSGFEQHDAHEFLTDLIEFLHEEHLKAKKTIFSGADPLPPVAPQPAPKDCVHDSGESNANNDNDDGGSLDDGANAATTNTTINAATEETLQGTDLKSSSFTACPEDDDDDFRLTCVVHLTCSSCGYFRSKEEIHRHLSLDVIAPVTPDAETTTESNDGKGISSNKKSSTTIMPCSLQASLEHFFRGECRKIKCDNCKDGKFAFQSRQITKRYVFSVQQFHHSPSLMQPSLSNTQPAFFLCLLQTQGIAAAFEAFYCGGKLALRR